MSEEWREIPGLEGKYEASDQGRIRSVPRRVTCRGGHTRQLRENFPEGTINPDGYRILDLCGWKLPAHLAVLYAFRGPRPFPRAQGRHLNGDRLDNRLGNLRWGTHRENMDDRRRHGNTAAGDRIATKSINEEVAKVIWYFRNVRPVSGTLLARLHGISNYPVYRVANNQNWLSVTAQLRERFS